MARPSSLPVGAKSEVRAEGPAGTVRGCVVARNSAGPRWCVGSTQEVRVIDDRFALPRLDLRGTDPAHAELPTFADLTDGPLEAVRAIIDDVRTRGDAALLDLTEKFDGVRLPAIAVPPERVHEALAEVAADVRAALRVAAERIRTFHEHQRRSPTTVEEDGIVVRSVHIPVDRVGCYVPGGRALYPSTVLMTAIPARVAGVAQIVLCVPPGPDGHVAPVTLAAAAVAGVDCVYAVGGAQAIAAMAFGTETISAVDVIAGPGNRYVATAKREVAGVVGVPSAFAGPSEVVVIADGSVPAAAVAADLLVQAEHGPDGLAWLITWDPAVVDTVEAEVSAQLASAPRAADIAATLATRGRAILVDHPAAALTLANRLAPEHLELMCADAEALSADVRHAGAVFCGVWSPASIGDYLAGPSHVLPTARTARFGQALTVSDFTKDIHIVTVSEAGFDAVADHVIALADAEGLDAHAQSIRVRRREGGA